MYCGHKKQVDGKLGQRGGRLGGDVTRGLVGGIRKGFSQVPLGGKVMQVVDPILDLGLEDVGKWERGEKGFESTDSYKEYKNLLDPAGIKARQKEGRRKWLEEQVAQKK